MMTKAIRLISRHLLLLIILASGVNTSAIANTGPRCEGVFSKSRDQVARVKITEQVPQLELSEMLFQLKMDGKLVYRGKHEFKAGTEFLASNEFDWLATPFDHKPSDVLVAFGTNSAWEIAVSKNVKSMYIGDWSPYPILASAYVVGPLIKIAKTPKELIVLLSGRIPTREITNETLDDVFNKSTRYAAAAKPEKLPETKKFLEFLAQQVISDFELKFLTSYFYGLAGQNIGANNLGPFSGLRYSSFARLLGFYDQRYSPTVAEAQNSQVTPLVTLERASVFSSQKNFDKLRQLFVMDQVHYGLTSITDMGFYRAIQKAEVAQGRSTYALSITNIFDCGDYNGLTHKDMQDFLMGTMNIFGTDAKSPLVVFRTTNTQPPHGFLRYDLTQPDQVRALKPQMPLGQAN